jgi:hypothetical protein
MVQDWMSDTEAHKQAMRSSIELPPIHASNIEPTSDPFSHLNPHRRRELLPSILNTSPPGRSSTLPPIQRSQPPNRPRKQSLSKRAREPQHKRQKSREQPHLRRMSYDRKAFSAEPSAGYGKRWEDLIDAATSATEEDEDRTPVRHLQLRYSIIHSHFRSPHPLYQYIVPHFPLSHIRNPTSRVTRPRLSSRHSHLRQIFPTPPSRSRQ